MKRTFSFNYTSPSGTVAVISCNCYNVGVVSPALQVDVTSIAVPYAGHMVNISGLFDDMDAIDLPPRMYKAIQDEALKLWQAAEKERATVDTAAQ